MEFWPTTTEFGSEFNKLIDSIGHYVIFRKMRRKEGVLIPFTEDDLEKSPTVDDTYDSGDMGRHDYYARGEKFLFDDQIIKAYRRPLSGGDVPLQYGDDLGATYFYYFKADVYPSRFDKIIEMKLEGGRPVSPITPILYLDIREAYPYQADPSGDIVYWRVFAVASGTRVIK